MTKLYDVVGVSAVRAGAPFKFRLANGKPARRARILERNGHYGVFLVSLDKAMPKEEAIAAFKEQYAEYDGIGFKRKAPKAEAVKATVAKAKAKAKADTSDAKLSPAALKAVNKVMSKVA